MPNETIIIPLKDKPGSVLQLPVGDATLLAAYDRRGNLRLLRKATNTQNPPAKPKPDETVLRIKDFFNGESTFKSAGSHCGFLSVNGCIYWGTIWDDDDGGICKKCTFQEWVDECALVLAGVKNAISKT